jgi:hypothetical protein
MVKYDKDKKNCEFNCKLCGQSREDPHYNDLYRSKYGHKPCVCRCHSPFSSKGKGLFSDSLFSDSLFKFTVK